MQPETETEKDKKKERPRLVGYDKEGIVYPIDPPLWNPKQSEPQSQKEQQQPEPTHEQKRIGDNNNCNTCKSNVKDFCICPKVYTAMDCIGDGFRFYEQQPKDDKDSECEWTMMDPDDDDTYETECGEAFTFYTDGPIENKFHYCPYCGKKIKVKKDKGVK